jgi:hypothetical protein
MPIPSTSNPIVNADALHQIWERLCQVTQRLILAKATKDSLAEVNRTSSDDENERLLHGLREEIVLLNIVKSQLEEAISKAVAQGLLTINDVSAGAKNEPNIPFMQSSVSSMMLEKVDSNGSMIEGNKGSAGALPSFGSAFSRSPTSV